MSQIEKGLTALIHKICNAIESIALGSDNPRCLVVAPEPGEKVFIFVVPEKHAGPIQTMLEIATGGEPEVLGNQMFYRSQE